MSRTTRAVNKPPLGALIATRLNEMGKNQKWLSENAQVNQVYLCAVLAGRANPTIKLLRRIARSLDIDVRELTNALLSEG